MWDIFKELLKNRFFQILLGVCLIGTVFLIVYAVLEGRNVTVGPVIIEGSPTKSPTSPAPSPPSPSSKSLQITSPRERDVMKINQPFDIKGKGKGITNPESLKLKVKEDVGDNTYCDDLNNKNDQPLIINEENEEKEWIFQGCELTKEGDYTITVKYQEETTKPINAEPIKITAKALKRN
jgi:hypothetical protein